MAMNFHRKLPIPQEVKKEYPLTDRMVKVKEERDSNIRAVFEGSSDKFILIIGPCSADHSEPVLEYISRLKKVEEQVKDKIIIIPRKYFHLLFPGEVLVHYSKTTLFPRIDPYVDQRLFTSFTTEKRLRVLQALAFRV